MADSEPATQSADPTVKAPVERIAALLSQTTYPRGNLAALRRLQPEWPTTAAFWQALAFGGLDIEKLSESDLRRWGTVVQALAVMSPSAHRRGVSVGRAFAEAGIKSGRVETLLAARGPAFRTLLRRLCRQLAGHAQPLDWRPLAELVLWESHSDWREEAAEAHRFAIARAYYRHNKTAA